MGEVCGEKKYIQDCGEETRRDHFEDLGIENKIILKRILKKKQDIKGVDWTYLDQDREKWQELVNKVMKHCVL
jgi:hypothetical protein